MSLLRPKLLSVSALDQSPTPIGMTLVKDYLAETSSDNDVLIEQLIFAAIHWAENAMRRSIYAREHVWILEDFPRDDRKEIVLPRGKTQDIISIAYSLSGTTTTLTGPSATPAGTDYQESLIGDDGGLIMPSRGEVWPDTDCDVPAPVTITFRAGWEISEIPDPIIHALLFTIADAYDLRGTGDFSGGGIHFETREILIAPYRIKRWY